MDTFSHTLKCKTLLGWKDACKTGKINSKNLQHGMLMFSVILCFFEHLIAVCNSTISPATRGGNTQQGLFGDGVEGGWEGEHHQ